MTPWNRLSCCRVVLSLSPPEQGLLQISSACRGLNSETHYTQIGDESNLLSIAQYLFLLWSDRVTGVYPATKLIVACRLVCFLPSYHDLGLEGPAMDAPCRLQSSRS
ncbi:hypothetical protein RRG08_001099 [Elysia crispata]|uniref:Uncharacterized protein n=1 Tax=Elysia crispata TaxID=231223 RepID=A0AAE1E6T1_9GAST|nr:hypothetical protein RRG08_001099 [Elysia crispata]